VSDAPVIDVHVHLSETKDLGAWSKNSYEIWEYGSKDDVAFGPASGDLDDLRDAMRAGDLAHAVVVNAFSVDEWRGRWQEGLEPNDPMSVGDALIAFNTWLVDAVAPFGDITPFVAADPWVLSAQTMVDHLEDMRRRGARGIKIHPIDQRFVVSDPRMLRVYEGCADLGLVVLSHAGTSRGVTQFAEPAAFDAIATAVPDLLLVVAHLGGGSWQQIRAIAATHPQVTFDLSEIVAWTGAPGAPDDQELVRLIRDIGVERVMFGSDFPWYDPGDMVKAVRTLPGLSDGELSAILGENAARIMRLPV
jgi:predicted TIM-barrel fold metal-dependent hydrolase